MNIKITKNETFNRKQNPQQKKISFCAYEKTFVIIKPDAFQRNLNKTIEKGLLTDGLKITKEFEGIAQREKMENNYIAKQHKSFFKDWINFLVSGKIKALIIEGEDAIAKVLKFKKEIRNTYAPNEKRYNLIHCSDDEINATREILNFFS